MSLQKNIMGAMKDAMKEKNTQALAALRAVKSAILLAQTQDGASGELSEEDEIKILQKQVKQRRDSAAIFKEQGRDDLAAPELEQADVIAQFLPKQLTEAEITQIIEAIIQKTGASTMKDMGKVMGMASAEMAGKADGKMISTIVKSKLS